MIGPGSRWLGLLGAALAALSFVVPVTELAGRSLTAWELLRLDQDLLGRIDRLPGKLKETPPDLPDLGPRPKIIDGIRDKGDELRAKFRLTHSILQYIQIGLIALLVGIGLPIAAAVMHRSRTVMPLLVGLAGFALAGTLVVLAVYLRGVELLDGPLPILAGYWLATTGLALLALAGLASLSADNWKWSLPAQVAPGLAWWMYLSYLLFH